MRVAITGGTGSLGSALIARLAREGADRIVAFSRDEQKRLALQQQYRGHPGVKVYAGDVRDPDRLRDIFHGCEVVIHAAARKVVSGHHDEPRELLHTNVLGTQYVLDAALHAGVGRVLLISSDKAVHAENAYGMSKALAEQLVISANAQGWPRGRRSSVIRYGNVLGSNGSVVRAWRPLAERGLPLPLSDARMTRFWLTLDMAVTHVLGAVAMMRGGEVFVPQLKAAPLTAVGEALLGDGSTPEFLITGIRVGGEKLYEELVSADEARRAVVRNGFVVIPPPFSVDLWDAQPWLGEEVSDGFEMRSDTWPDRWTRAELAALLR